MSKRKSQSTKSAHQTKRKRADQSENNNDSDPMEESMPGPSQGSSQGPSQQQSSQSTTSNNRSGKILSIRLRNFMCHENLKVDFNRHANLLVGQNGSGKSAILTALIVGLGSRANATNRCNNIKQLIRNGEQSGSIEITLSNDGSDDYKRNVYGDEITVIRTISASGSSTYKLKDFSGRTISTSRAELNKLILFMNIQVDNPLCVLTQDASRSFLRDSDPKKRYELFMKATQLDVVLQILDKCVVQNDNIESKLNVKKSIKIKLQKDEQLANEKLSRFRSMEPLKAEIKRYQIEQQWLVVKSQEDFIEEINHLSKQAQDQRTEFESKLQEVIDSGTQNTQKITELTADVENITQKLNADRQRLDELKTNHKNQNEELIQITQTFKTFQAKKQNIENAIQQLKESIQDELQSNKSQVQDIKEANEQKLKELHSKSSDLEATIRSHKRDQEVFNGANTKYKTLNDQIEQKKLKLNDEKRRIEMQLKNINPTPKEILKQIADYMPVLVDEINKHYRNKKFKKLPIGPIASHVQVKNPQYRSYVEDVLDKLMFAFCVDNPDDGRTLRDLIKSRFQNVNIPIITSRFVQQEYDVSTKCVKSDLKTVSLLDLIEINDCNVKNCLIDQLGIDTILFCDDFEHSTRITSNAENVPANLSRVILLKPYSEFYPMPNYRTYTKKSKNTRFLQLNVADRKRAYQNELIGIEEKIKSVQNEMDELTPKILENKKLLNERIKSIRESEVAFRVLSLEIEELQGIEYPEEIEVSVMQNEVKAQTKLLENAKSQCDEWNKKQIDKSTEVKSIESIMQQCKMEILQAEKEIEKKNKTKDKLKELLGKRDSTMKHYKNKIDETNKTLDALLREFNKAKEKLNRLEATALRVGARIEPTHTDEELIALIKNNEKKINAVCKSKESEKELSNQLSQLQAQIADLDVIIDGLGKSVNLMRKSINLRYMFIKSLKKFMMIKISHMFTTIMRLRDCHGNLEFSDEKHTLDIKVVPRDKHCDSAVSKTTNLSGGERSYVTVAFLIALWSCVDSPFYFLDEYDVFTDQINRMFMTKLLLNEAHKKKWFQYTFLTPQDTSEITASDDLKILRLEDPQR